MTGNEDENVVRVGGRMERGIVFTRFILVYLTPIAFCILFAAAGTDPPVRCLYVAGIMGIYWASEALPLAVTALIPIAAFPLLGIEDTKTVVGKYMSNVVMMFLGGLIVAVAVENSNLHRRIALNLIKIIGTSPNRVMLSFMGATGFLSMWISNTAATALMIPIAKAIIDSLARNAHGSIAKSFQGSSGAILLLSVAYAANIGGMAVVTGTPPNLVAFKILDPAVTFPAWMGFALPLALVNIILCWLYLRGVIAIFNWIENGKTSAGYSDVSLSKMNVDSPKDNTDQQDDNADPPTVFVSAISTVDKVDSEDHAEDIKSIVNKHLKELGSITYKELVVTGLFVSLVALWFFQRPKFIVGWADLLEEKKVGAATPAILVVLLVFMIPAKNPFPGFRRGKPAEYLITWDLVEEKIPWGIILLLGGGLALSHGFKASELDKIIVRKTKAISGNVSVTGLNFIVCFATSMVTEVVSNTATSNIVLPMLMDISKALCVNPIYLVMSAVITCSNAFMLPVATAPNALIFGAMDGKITTSKMMLIGFPLNVISLLVTITAIETWGTAMFDLNQYHERVENNSTTTWVPINCTVQ